MTPNTVTQTNLGSVRNGVSAAVRTGAVIFGISIAIAVLFWTAFAVAFGGIDGFWLAPVAVFVLTAAPFAVGALLYAAIWESIDRFGPSVTHPAAIATLLFATLAIGSWIVGVTVWNSGLFPFSGPGAFTGLIVAIGAAILANNGHIHHESQ